MQIINPQLGNGLTFSDQKMTLNFDPSVHAEKRSDGIYINAGSLGGGIEGAIDDHTIKIIDTDQQGHAILGIDRNVVVSIFTMCQYQVTDRSTKSTYAVSQTIKSIGDIVDELNAVLIWYDNHQGQTIDQGVPHTAYKLTVGDFFQFRATAIPTQYSDGTHTWPVATDDGYRTQNVPITAFFTVKSISYDYNDRVTALELQCLWSTLSGSYVAGQTYSYPSSP